MRIVSLNNCLFAYSEYVFMLNCR